MENHLISHNHRFTQHTTCMRRMKSLRKSISEKPQRTSTFYSSRWSCTWYGKKTFQINRYFNYNSIPLPSVFIWLKDRNIFLFAPTLLPSSIIVFLPFLPFISQYPLICIAFAKAKLSHNHKVRSFRYDIPCGIHSL